jgi:hypothetical protein
MKSATNQTLIGAAVAAILTISALAVPNAGAAGTVSNQGLFSPSGHETVAQAKAAIEEGCGPMLDAAFDAYGEIAAVLKQF